MLYQYQCKYQYYKEILKTPPIIAFQKIASLKQIIGTNIIRNNKKYLISVNYFPREKYSPCSGTCTMCCKHINATAIFTNNQTIEIFDICFTLIYKSKYVIY